jgi:hypothetical protein
LVREADHVYFLQRKRVGNLQTKEQLRREYAPLELCLDGRNLTDDGLREVVEGLKDVIGNANGTPYFALEELNLAHNSLTSNSLRALAPVIYMSSGHLKDLDLSGNLIKAVERTEIDDWEVFLDSFRDCYAMRRLVLSNCDFSGSMAFERFIKHYCQTPVMDQYTSSTCCELCSC